MAGPVQLPRLQAIQLPQERPLLEAEVLRGGDNNLVHLITRRLRGRPRRPRPDKPARPAGWRALGKIDPLIAIQSGDADGAAPGGLGKRNLDLAVNIVAHPGEKIMRGYMDYH